MLRTMSCDSHSSCACGNCHHAVLDDNPQVMRLKTNHSILIHVQTNEPLRLKSMQLGVSNE